MFYTALIKKTAFLLSAFFVPVFFGGTVDQMSYFNQQYKYSGKNGIISIWFYCA